MNGACRFWPKAYIATAIQNVRFWVLAEID